jgi:hypothetical protein
MGFFKTSEGRVHGGRIAGIIYIISLLPGCHYFHDIDRLCLMRMASTAGWWLSFCDQTQPRTFAEMLHHPRRAVGVITLVAGLVAHFYFISRS